MFKLYVASTDVSSGTIPISWCVSKDKLKELASDGVEDPQVVICIAPDDHYHITKEHRVVVPLKDLMTYVEFRHPGKNKIYGIVSFKGKKIAQNHYLSKGSSYRRGYDNNILNFNGDDWAEDFKSLTHKHVVSVDVPADCFAPEPSAWEKAWVNHHFQYKCSDQCHFRRRRMFAYTIQPIVMAFWLVLRLLVLTAALLVGARNASKWKRVFKPLTYNFTDVMNIFGGGTVFVRPPRSGGCETAEPNGNWAAIWFYVKHIWLVPFMPLFMIPLLIVYLVSGIGLVLTILTWAAIVVGLICGVLLGTAAAGMLYAKLTDTDSRKKRRKKKFWYEDMDHLVCDGTVKPMDVSRLPRKYRTIKLRFSELKAKVCRPFSG